MGKICSVDGCGKHVDAKGFCRAHYARWSRHGDPLAGRTFEGELLRFIHDVALNHSGEECLLWPFGDFSNGYGRVSVDGKGLGAHRYVCTLIHGEPPTPDHESAHNCGKGHLGCIAPGHLEWKTSAENQADRIVHGTHQRGERNNLVKLTEDDVRKIRALRGLKTQKEIAAEFGIERSNVSCIHRMKSWAWLQEANCDAVMTRDELDALMARVGRINSASIQPQHAE